MQPELNHKNDLGSSPAITKIKINIWMNTQSTMEHISRELYLNLAFIDVYNFDEMEILPKFR